MARKQAEPKYDRAKDLRERAEDTAEAAVDAATDDALEAQNRLYDKYSFREVANAAAITGFRKRKTGAEPNPSAKEIIRLRAQAQAAEQRAEDAKREAERARQEQAKPTPTPIRQGVKSQVDTVPMPVRLTVHQMKALKLLAAMEGRTASGIIRACVDAYLEQRTSENPSFAAALAAQH